MGNIFLQILLSDFGENRYNASTIIRSLPRQQSLYKSPEFLSIKWLKFKAVKIQQNFKLQN